METKPATVTIGGKEYELENLSEEARNQLKNLQFTEAEIRQSKMRLAMLQTARSAYHQALLAALPKDPN